MKKPLIVVDMQNDFIDMALGTKEAVAIVPKVKEKIAEYVNNKDEIIFTRDTHFETYPETQEGRKLPVLHCVKGTEGWQIHNELIKYCDEVIDKVTFGSSELAMMLSEENERDNIKSITLVGLCTDICVISNAMTIKAFLPETEITVDAACCAGVTHESHKTALSAMKTCQINIENE